MKVWLGCGYWLIRYATVTWFLSTGGRGDALVLDQLRPPPEKARQVECYQTLRFGELGEEHVVGVNPRLGRGKPASLRGPFHPPPEQSIQRQPRQAPSPRRPDEK